MGKATYLLLFVVIFISFVVFASLSHAVELNRFQSKDRSTLSVDKPFGISSQFSVFASSLSSQSAVIYGSVAVQNLTVLEGSTIHSEKGAQSLITKKASISLSALSQPILVESVSEGEWADCCHSHSCSSCSLGVTSTKPVNFIAGAAHLHVASNELAQHESTFVNDDSSFQTLQCDSEQLNVFALKNASQIRSLVIDCNINQDVVVQYSGTTKISSFQMLLKGGISSAHVLHHFLGQKVSISSSTIEGSVLAPQGRLVIDSSTITGQVIANNLTLKSNGNHKCVIQGSSFKGDLQLTEKPNLVIFLADDMGYGDLSSYGAPDIKTPHIDKLAYGGKKLTTFYSQPMCTPTRSAILTGRYPIRNGCYNDQSYSESFGSTPIPVFYPPSYGMLPESEILLSNLLEEQGYQNGMFGKWHLGTINDTALPLQRGFHRYWGMPYSSDMGCPPAVGWECAPTAGPAMEWVPVPVYDDNTIIEQPTAFDTFMPRLNEQVVEFINASSQANQPFFMHLSYLTPHVPLFTAPKFSGVSSRGLYGDVIEEIDASVGLIVQILEELGELDNTLLVFTSDNGPAVYFGSMAGSPGLFRGGKGTTWEGGVRVPSIWYWPGLIDAASIAHSITSVVDIFTTFASVAGASIPTDREIDGKDLSGVLFNNENLDRECVPYYSQQYFTAVRCGDYKLHYYEKENMVGTPVVVNPPLLFNVRLDPSENNPLDLNTYKSIVTDITNFKTAWLSALTPGPAQFELYNHTVGAYQPCCDASTDCHCPAAGTPHTATIAQLSEYYEATKHLAPVYT